MKNALEKLRRFLIRRRCQDEGPAKLSRSISFRKTSVRQSLRRITKRKAVVTNHGIVYVDCDSRKSSAITPAGELNRREDNRSSDENPAGSTPVRPSTSASNISEDNAEDGVVLRRRKQNVISSTLGEPKRTELRVSGGLFGGVTDIISQAQKFSKVMVHEEKSVVSTPEVCITRADTEKEGSELSHPVQHISGEPEEILENGGRDRQSCSSVSSAKREVYYADYGTIEHSVGTEPKVNALDPIGIADEGSICIDTIEHRLGKIRHRKDTDGDSGRASCSGNGSLERAVAISARPQQKLQEGPIPAAELRRLEDMLASLTTDSQPQHCRATQTEDALKTDAQTAFIQELQLRLSMPCAPDEPPDQRATAALNRNVSVARRKPPTVVATRDNLRRISSRRRRRSSAATSHELYRKRSSTVRPPPTFTTGAPAEFYRNMMASVPSSVSSSPGVFSATAGPSNPFVFSRRNPVTQWLTDSEAETRRCASEADLSPLWSELLMGDDLEESADRPSQVTSVPVRRRSRRGSNRARRSSRAKNVASLVKTTTEEALKTVNTKQHVAVERTDESTIKSGS